MKVEGIIFIKNKINRKFFYVMDKDEVVSFQLKNFSLSVNKKDLLEILDRGNEYGNTKGV